MKIAISGTYSTGKTTTTLALSYLTGISCTHARTMREILPATFPDKRLEECWFHEIIELGMRRFSERVVEEANYGGFFISDGCSLQEWIYGSTRMMTGLNPDEDPEKIKTHKALYKAEWDVFQETIQGFGRVVKNYARSHYDAIIHLPVEFPLVIDGHRPTSELFRRKSDELLNRTYTELDAHVFSVNGNLKERLLKIADYLGIEHQISIDQAIEKAILIRKEYFDSIQLEKTNT